MNVGGMLVNSGVVSVAASATNPNDLWIAEGEGGVWRLADGGTQTGGSDVVGYQP